MRSKGPRRAASVVVAKRLLVSLLAIALVHTIATVIAVQVSAEKVSVPPEPIETSQVALEKAATEVVAPKSEEVSSAGSQEGNTPVVGGEEKPNLGGERKGRAEAKADDKGEQTAKAKAEPEKKSEEKKVEEKKDTSATKTGVTVQANNSAKTRALPTSKPASGSGASKSKLPANLGTVTSTGSGGPTHYMSKHDAYSAIAEKHGALAHDAMRKSDKRHSSSSSSHSSAALQPFGIHKAGGGPIGDLLSPFRGVADNGLARTLGASMRSIMKSKYSVPAYVASALLGAVALLAFYESPISPLPVPPLPEPPLGRFPPEMPVIPANTQVPFRGNQQTYSNQRSAPMNQFMGSNQQPQVLFPGQQQPQQQQVAQQRQMPSASGGGLAAPVQQLAANLVANLGGKQQAAQRKSSADGYYVGGPYAGAQPLFLASSATASKPNPILSFFGLGGSSNSAKAQAPASGGDLSASASTAQIGGVGQAAGAGTDASGKPQSSSGPGLSNSHLVNKVKSYFSRGGTGQQVGAMSSPTAGSSSSSAATNPYDQYQRMSFVQALMKDTAFLPAFLSPNRKSSSGLQAPKMVAPSSSSSQPSAAARMALTDSSAQLTSLNQLAPAINLPAASKQASSAATAAQKPASSFGLVRAADRIAHALLDTFTSSIAQRGVAAAMASAQDNLSARRSLGGLGLNSDDSGSSLASATTSLLSDIMTSYSNQQPQVAASSNDYQQPANNGSPASSSISSENGQVNASSRSDVAQEDKTPVQAQQQPQPQASPASTVTAASSQQQQQQPTKQQSSIQPQLQGQQHVRKTRSIGFEYPIESQSQLAVREQQPAGPSKAAQINNVIDFVADNSVLFKFVMNQVGLSQAVPYVEYVEQILAPEHHQHH